MVRQLPDASCLGCGRPLERRRRRGRPPRWCTDACRKRAARREKG